LVNKGELSQNLPGNATGAPQLTYACDRTKIKPRPALTLCHHKKVRTYELFKFWPLLRIQPKYVYKDECDLLKIKPRPEDVELVERLRLEK